MTKLFWQSNRELLRTEWSRKVSSWPPEHRTRHRPGQSPLDSWVVQRALCAPGWHHSCSRSQDLDYVSFVSWFHDFVCCLLEWVPLVGRAVKSDRELMSLHSTQTDSRPSSPIWSLNEYKGFACLVRLPVLCISMLQTDVFPALWLDLCWRWHCVLVWHGASGRCGRTGQPAQPALRHQLGSRRAPGPGKGHAHWGPAT